LTAIASPHRGNLGYHLPGGCEASLGSHGGPEVEVKRRILIGSPSQTSHDNTGSRWRTASHDFSIVHLGVALRCLPADASYLPTGQMVDEGGYEGRSTIFAATAEERVRSDVAHLLRQMGVA
jgi:hypothetical protein